MTIKVALHHRTHYAFDRAVNLSPHEVRLRPAAHCRTPIEAYSIKVKPAKHFLNWQQDPYGNWLARLVFPEMAKELEITVELVADMTVINPFDFFVDKSADQFPFAYAPENARELAAYLETEPPTARLAAWIERARARHLGKPILTIDFLVALNRDLQQDVRYLIRMEAGIQPPEFTLESAQGSCRDSAWLLVQILRRFGIAARFASGYLIQLVADVKALDGPSGTAKDFTDLHAWCEAYIPGAGWIGLDPTSGLLTGEGHIPLACAALPTSAAPVTGFTDPCETKLDFSMSVSRLYEDPRVTRPYSEAQWAGIAAMGARIDRELADGDVRLTMGGEPTFVSIDDMEGAEWNYIAHSEKKYALAVDLLHRLRKRFAPGSLLHFGQGKWYPGEPLPRWALSCHWRRDGVPLWEDEKILPGLHAEEKATPEEARRFADELAGALGLEADAVIPAYEDPWKLLREEANLPANFDLLAENLANAAVRQKLRDQLTGKIGTPVGYVLPLRAAARGKASDATTWLASHWPLRRGQLFLTEGDSPIGYRLPLASLPTVLPGEEEPVIAADPFDRRDALGKRKPARAATAAKRAIPKTNVAPREVVKTALCIEARNGHLYVFMPPLALLEDFVALVSAIESTAQALERPVRLEGYTPPDDPRVAKFGVTPDPGVIEVNIHPASNWQELEHNVQALYEEARQARLGTEKFMLDGRHTGTGGGNHVTLGGPTAADSPLLRRPDLLRSLVTYWQNHPALSYLFSGMFIGPTSQAPRVDEARNDTLYELEIAFQQLEREFKAGETNEKPWLVDRILRNFLVDLTGNTHRAEFSIDKLYAPGTRDGTPGPAGIPRLRDAAARAHEPRADAAAARAGRALLEGAVPRGPRELGHASARRIHAAALRRAGHARRRRRSQGGGLSVPVRMVRAVLRVPLPALRLGRLRRHRARAAPGDRALARAGRAGRADRHVALRRFVDRAPASEGDAVERGAPRDHRERALHPDDFHGALGRVRRGRALSRVGAALGAASHHRHPRAARVRPRGPVEPALARRLHLSRRASGRAQLFDLPGERARSGSEASRALPGDGAHGRNHGVRKEARNPRFPVTLDMRKAPEAPD